MARLGKEAPRPTLSCLIVNVQDMHGRQARAGLETLSVSLYFLSLSISLFVPRWPLTNKPFSLCDGLHGGPVKDSETDSSRQL